MSITETATGNPATTASFVVRIEPPSQSATSVDVPPMSNVMMFANPEVSADRNAPTTPPDGPERIVRTGSTAARSAEILPPDDCITRSANPVLGVLFCVFRSFGGLFGCVSLPAFESRFRYRPINGWRYALMTTVDVRSYSRYSGKTRLESEIGTPNEPSAAAIRSSCSACRTENRRQTAIDSTPDLFNFAVSFLNSTSSSGSITSPDATTRSATPNRSSSATSDGGLTALRL